MKIQNLDGTVATVFSIGGDASSIDLVVEQGDKKIIVHLDKPIVEALAVALKETAKKR